MSLFPVQYQDVMLLVVEGHPGQVPGTGFASLVLMHGLVFGIACFSHRLSVLVPHIASYCCRCCAVHNLMMASG